MSKVFISRPDDNVAWGFRLQGGLEYNEPLTITQIVPNSPADGKIDAGDMLIEIAGTNVTQTTHKDALELIQSCGNNILLTLQKADDSYPPDTQKLTEEQQESSYSYDSSSEPQHNITSKPMESPTLSPILAKYLSRPGVKPFTYIPPGLDLSKLRELRAKRFQDNRSTSEDNQAIMNRRLTVPSDQLNQHHYTNTNPIQPFSYSHQPPTPPKKYIQHDTDVITQCRSFQMLQEWISDSEKTIPTVIPSLQSTTNSSTVAQTTHDQQNKTTPRQSSLTGISSLPSRSFRYLQEQYSVDSDDTTIVPKKSFEETTSKSGTGLRRSSDAHNPSRAFKYLQDQYDISQELASNQSRTINNRDDLVEIYNKPPPSSREREPDTPHYKGSTVPSRAFRFLQMMTHEDDEQNDLKSNINYTKPQELLFNKYDEQHVSTHANRLSEHPSRSFKYLQELTGEQQSTSNQTATQSRTLTNNINSTDIGASSF
ncbi:unnamed protein product [Rotaria sordida]|uniref:PDZ domain-containing protein n=1 Tax=Rotaria sordida TaxID=392033 RepID=A0A818TDH6_9BILA|nr:unnamed protein product [Rotaria sordida]CAF3681628.1 unnamed protein product [Rotaria sordida]